MWAIIFLFFKKHARWENKVQHSNTWKPDQMVISRKGCGLMIFPECHIFKACPGLSVVLFSIWIFQEAPQKPSFKKIFLERWGRDMSTNPQEYTFSTWADCLKVKFYASYCFAVVTKIECTSYLVMLVVGKMGILHLAVFFSQFYQLTCFSKINCCATCCNLFFF